MIYSLLPILSFYMLHNFFKKHLRKDKIKFSEKLNTSSYIFHMLIINLLYNIQKYLESIVYSYQFPSINYKSSTLTQLL